MQLQPKSNSSAAVFILSYTHTHARATRRVCMTSCEPVSLFVAMSFQKNDSVLMEFSSTSLPGWKKVVRRYSFARPTACQQRPGGVVARLPERREARMDRRAASACAAIDAEPQSELLFNPIAVFPFVAAQTFANALLTGWCRYGLAHH